jgi:potassium efflux system protein
VLRVYLAELEERLDVIHDLHSTIHDEFNKAGIEIAFPQQDIHIRSLPKEMTLPPAGAEPARHQRAA